MRRLRARARGVAIGVSIGLSLMAGCGTAEPVSNLGASVSSSTEVTSLPSVSSSSTEVTSLPGLGVEQVICWMFDDGQAFVEAQVSNTSDVAYAIYASAGEANGLHGLAFLPGYGDGPRSASIALEEGATIGDGCIVEAVEYPVALTDPATESFLLDDRPRGSANGVSYATVWTGTLAPYVDASQPVATPPIDEGWGDSPKALRVTTEADAIKLCQRLIPDGPAFVRALGMEPDSGPVGAFSYPTEPRSDIVSVGCYAPMIPNSTFAATFIHLTWWPVWEEVSEEEQDVRSNGSLFVQGTCAEATIVETLYDPSAISSAKAEMSAILQRLCG